MKLNTDKVLRDYTKIQHHVYNTGDQVWIYYPKPNQSCLRYFKKLDDSQKLKWYQIQNKEQSYALGWYYTSQ